MSDVPIDQPISPTTNEAAERLRDIATASEFEWDDDEWERAISDLRTTERRNTVERIRDYYDFDKCPVGLRLHIDAIFDETEPPGE